jgi:hypothetical protein
VLQKAAPKKKAVRATNFSALGKIPAQKKAVLVFSRVA